MTLYRGVQHGHFNDRNPEFFSMTVDTFPHLQDFFPLADLTPFELILGLCYSSSKSCLTYRYARFPVCYKKEIQIKVILFESFELDNYDRNVDATTQRFKRATPAPSRYRAITGTVIIQYSGTNQRGPSRPKRNF